MAKCRRARAPARARASNKRNDNKTSASSTAPQQPTSPLSASSQNLAALPPELLESILVFLPPKDLIGARGVSRGFRDFIDSSKKLQQAAFLQAKGVLSFATNEESTDTVQGDSTTTDPTDPAPTVPRLRAWVLDRATSTITPALHNPSEALSLKGFISNSIDWRDEQGAMHHAGSLWPLTVFPISLNPTLLAEDGAPAPGGPVCRACDLARALPSCHHCTPRPEDFPLTNSVLPQPGAKFWDMLLSEPAATTVRLKHDTHPGSDPLTTVVYNREGLRMRDLFEGFHRLGLGIEYGGGPAFGKFGVVGSGHRVDVDFLAAACVRHEDLDAVERGLTCPGTGSPSRRERSGRALFEERCHRAAPRPWQRRQRLMSVGLLIDEMY